MRPCSSSSTSSATQWLVLAQANRLHALMGDQGVEVVTRIMGLMLAAFAVEYMLQGWSRVPG